MRAPRKWTKTAAILALGIAAWAGAGCSRPSADEARARAVHERLVRAGGCDLWNDPQGIPHVRSRDELSLYACFGFLHGRDRGWEMDYFRRIAQGRTAEVLGRQRLRGDFLMRMLGLHERAQRLYERLPADRQERLLAYSEGATLGMREGARLGQYEFRELGYEPEPWLPADTLALVYLESFDQTRETFERQIDEQEWLTARGGDRAAGEVSRLYRDEALPWSTTILKPGEYPRRAIGRESASVAPRGRGAGLLASLGFEDVAGRGSNNWVVAARRSATGNAWLANDPHLGLNRPAFWHWVNISLDPGTGAEPPLDVIGASLPGLPVIVSGANRHASWGLTNSYLPVARLGFVPENELKGSERTSWPVIWIRFWKFRLPFFFKAYRRTAQGWPVLPLELPGAPKGAVPVLRWTGFDIDPAGVAGLEDIMGARSIEELDRAFARVGVPSWNFVFADTQGRIGYRAVGRVPAFRGDLPQGIPIETLRGDKSAEAFPRVLSAEQMPHVLEPRRGVIVTANNRQWPRDSELSAGDAQLASFRAFRIEELLEKRRRHDLGSLREIQCDVQSVDARFLIPRMLQAMESLVERLGDGERQALHILRSWDFTASLDCKACAIARRWIDRSLGDGLNEGALYRSLENGRAGAELLATLRASLRGALGDLGLKPDESNAHVPQWGDLHLNFFDHLAGEDLFQARAPIATPGDDTSVNPGSAVWRGGKFRHRTGASERLIVELSSPPTVYSILPGTERDSYRHDLSEAGSPWREWTDCRLRRRVFPLSWDLVPSEKVSF